MNYVFLWLLGSHKLDRCLRSFDSLGHAWLFNSDSHNRLRLFFSIVSSQLSFQLSISSLNHLRENLRRGFLSRSIVDLNLRRQSSQLHGLNFTWTSGLRIGSQSSCRWLLLSIHGVGQELTTRCLLRSLSRGGSLLLVRLLVHNFKSQILTEI